MSFTGWREVTEEDIKFVAWNIRDADLRELRAVSNRPAVEIIREGVRYSRPARVAVINDEPVAIFGVVPFDDPGIGSIWMIGTDSIELSPISFLRRCKDEMEDLLAGYCYVSNICHAENTLHLKWLKWLGFTVDEEVIRTSHNDEPFHHFHKNLLTIGGQPCVPPQP